MTRIASLIAISLILMGLSGCDSPSPRMFDAQSRTVEVEGSTFGVHWKDGAVEIYRTSMEWLPSLSATMAKAAKAVEIATGCKVAPGTMVGDAALMKAELAC